MSGLVLCLSLKYCFLLKFEDPEGSCRIYEAEDDLAISSRKDESLPVTKTEFRKCEVIHAEIELAEINQRNNW
jgi:hypothetical protein